MIGPILLIVVCILLGIVFSMGKGAFLIAGYNTMPKARKEQYDATALCRFMGKMMFVLGGSMVFWLLGDIFAQEWLITTGFVVFLALVVFMVVYANTGNRFKK